MKNYDNLERITEYNLEGLKEISSCGSTCSTLEYKDGTKIDIWESQSNLDLIEQYLNENKLLFDITFIDNAGNELCFKEDIDEWTEWKIILE
jgi:hypothetical protein